MNRANAHESQSGEPFDLPLLIFHLRNVSPFFGALMMFAESVVTDRVPTAATDGRRLFFNPAFMSLHPVKEQLGVLVHELLHAALRHVERRSGADPNLWNIAADIVVNGMIHQTHGLSLPKSGLRDQDLENFPVEEVYQLLLKKNGPPKSIRFLSGDLLEPAGELAEGLSEHWNSALAQAAVVSRMGGNGQGRHPCRHRIGHRGRDRSPARLAHAPLAAPHKNACRFHPLRPPVLGRGAVSRRHGW